MSIVVVFTIAMLYSVYCTVYGVHVLWLRRVIAIFITPNGETGGQLFRRRKLSVARKVEHVFTVGSTQRIDCCRLSIDMPL